MKKIVFLPLSEHIKNLASKQYSSEELTEACLDRIEETRNLNSFITLDAEQALVKAKEADSRRRGGASLSELDGIPYAAKDNICTKGMLTTCSSNILRNYISPYDATVISRLASKGAVLLGKTNLDEFAMGDRTENSIFGPTLNPHDTSKTAGGSSGGSAAAVAAYQVPFALGSDTGGSVRQPAAFCGVVGSRLSYGAVSRYGLVSFAPSLDIIGAITRNILDNAIVTSHICGADEKDSTSFQLDFAPSQSINKDIAGMKIALLADLPEVQISNVVKNALQISAAKLKELGAKVEEISLKYAPSAYATYYTLVCAEASSNLSRFDGVRYGLRAQDYTDITSLYNASRSQGLGKEAKKRILFGAMALSAEHKASLYDNAINMRNLISHELCSVLSDFDAILLPTAPRTAYGLSEPPAQICNDDIFCSLASLSGMPAISIPYMTEDSLPIGIQLIGNHCTEDKLYRIAYALEGGLL